VPKDGRQLHLLRHETEQLIIATRNDSNPFVFEFTP